MALLTAVLSHLDAASVRKELAYLRALAPGSRFLICHGGKREDFDGVDDPDAVFIDDATLRDHQWNNSYNTTLQTIWEARARDDPAVEHLLLIEYDHLILRPDFETTFERLGERTGAGLLAKMAGRRNDTNWFHHVRLRDDAALARYVSEISRRDDPTTRFGALGNGMFFRRDALEAFCSLDNPPDHYLEVFVPTVLHHLGFDVVDVDAVSDLYMNVRWVPPYTVDEAVAAKLAGRTFVHPFKAIDALDAVLAAPGPGA
jgi:hypothetical protein